MVDMWDLAVVIIMWVFILLIGIYISNDSQHRLEVTASEINFTSNMTDKEKMAIIDEKCELYMRGSSSCKYDLYERLITGGE